MPNYLITLILLMILAIPAWTQEEEASGEPTQESAGTAVPELAPDEESDVAGEADEEQIEDSDLDDQSYDEDDDDFVPTEEIPADEPIPFPSNI
jgi:adenine-specific DNA methylase